MLLFETDLAAERFNPLAIFWAFLLFDNHLCAVIFLVCQSSCEFIDRANAGNAVFGARLLSVVNQQWLKSSHAVDHPGIQKGPDIVSDLINQSLP